jgi:uncharacterized protein (DUF2147 family)
MRIFLFIICLSALSGIIFAHDPDDVLGVWMIESQEAKVELYKNAQGKLEGRLVWLKDMYDDQGLPRKDINNDDKNLRNRTILGLTLAFGFEWNAETREWQNGSVYVPGNGNTYCGAIKLKPDGTLFLRGYLCGLRFLGKTSYCTRSTLSGPELALLTKHSKP